MIATKRERTMCKFDKKEFEINPSQLIINEEIKQKMFFKESEFYEFVKDLLDMDYTGQNDHIKLGVFLLRKHLANNIKTDALYLLDGGILNKLEEILALSVRKDESIVVILYKFNYIV